MKFCSKKTILDPGKRKQEVVLDIEYNDRDRYWH